MRRPIPNLLVFAILLLTLFVYWPGLAGPLLFDDNDNLRPIAAWLEGRVGLWPVVFGNESGHFGRSLSMLSFAINAMLLGSGVWGLKFGNLLLHLINGVLVFALFVQLGQRQNPLRTIPARAAWLAWFGAAIWLLHPLLLSTVLYLVQRMAILSATFTLLAMLAYLHGRSAIATGDKPLAIGLLGAAVPLLTVMAALSKENGVLTPSLCAVIELFLYLPVKGRQRNWLASAFIGIALVLPAIVAVGLALSQTSIIVAGYANRSFTLYERVLTEPRVL